MRGLAHMDDGTSYVSPFTIARLVPSDSSLTTTDYTTAIALSASLTKTATDSLVFAATSVEFDMDDHESDRSSTGYKEVTIRLKPVDNVPQGAEVACTTTITTKDALAKEYYGGTT